MSDNAKETKSEVESKELNELLDSKCIYAISFHLKCLTNLTYIYDFVSIVNNNKTSF